MRVPRFLHPTITIEDDRGKRHDFDIDKRGDTSEARARLKMLNQRVWDEATPKADGLTEGDVVLWLVLLVIGFGAIGVAGVAPGWARYLVFPILFVGVASVAYRWTVARRRDRIVSIYREHELCACCGYDLVATPPDPDALTTCPECGAAWRLDAGEGDPMEPPSR